MATGTATYNWTLAGTNTLTLGSSPNINVLNQTSTISAAIAGTSGLTKSGVGTLILSATTKPSPTGWP